MRRTDLDIADLEHLGAMTAPAAVDRLAALVAALPTCDDPAALEQLARALPGAVAALEPEVCLALQTLATALIPQRPSIPRDTAALGPRLRVGWRRVALAAGDPAALASLTDDELLQVTHGWQLDEVLDPAPLLRRLARASDARLRTQALEWIEPAMRQLAVTPGDALALLLPLAADPDPALRARAVTMACSGWLLEPPPAVARERERLVLAALADPEPTVVHAAIAAAAALGRRDWLLERALADEGPAQAAEDALDALGPLAHDEDIDLALALATSAPLRFGPPLRRFLLAAHRHGVFVRAGHLGPLLACFDAHPPWTAEELVRVTYIARGELVERLAALPADDPRWLRRADILAASFGTRAPIVLRERLEQVRDVAVAAAWIDAAGRSPEYVGEAPLLAWLATLPERVIPALRVKGGPESALKLYAIVVDPGCGARLRSLALEVLWALADDRAALLRDLAARLGPHASGLLDAARLVHRDREVARIVAAAPWPADPVHALEPARRLEVLCESGDIDHMPAVVALFREVFRGVVRRALAGDFVIKRVALPELEQRLFRYGRHLLREGRSVRRWLEPGPETGRDLVLQVALDWLREEPGAPVCVALLELIGRHSPGPATLRFIEPLWRHTDREVRRAAIEAILAAGEQARGLELSICRLAAHEEPRILCQALAAVATLRARWAEPIALGALQHREMAVKKEAALALAEVAGERSIAALVGWLAHHDNRGFREALLAALQRAAGPALVAVLVAALADETEARRVELLRDALSGRLPLAAALRLARSPRPADQALLTACLDGAVKLADADPAALAAQLHRARLLPRPPAPDPGRTLRLEGFSPAAARALVEQRAPKLEAAILATVRAALAEWIAWLRPTPALDAAPQPTDAPRTLDAAPLHADVAPRELDPAPRKLDAAPRKLDVAPRPDDAAPHPTDAAPRKLDGAPLHADAAPRELDGAPHHAAADSVEARALALVLDAAQPQHAEHVGALLELAAHGLATVDQAALAGFLERCVVGRAVGRRHEVAAIGLLRAAPAAPALPGLRRYRLLGRLGAVRTAADLERCLDVSRVGPEHAADSAALLCEALAIPAPVADEPPELSALREQARRWHAQEPRARAAWLATTLTARPLDLPAPPPRPAPPRPRFHPRSQADLEALLATLQDGDEQERSRAATRLLDWPDAAPAWPQVLAAFLRGRVDLGASHSARLAPLLTRWPAEPGARQAARALVPHCSPHQRRELVRAWVDGWSAGDAAMALLLQTTDEELLLPLVWAAAERGDYRLARLLRPGGSPALRAFVAWALPRAPDEVEHLVAPPPEPAQGGDDLDDPIAGQDADGLLALLSRKDVARGLAVRAVHALAALGEPGAAPLSDLVVDPRPPVRSAALRALRQVATREQSLDAAARALAMETRPAVLLQLMQSLGHGRHEPSLPALLERLDHREPKVREGAQAAIRAWGPEVVPTLRRAARHARPDRRPHYTALIAELERSEP